MNLYLFMVGLGLCGVFLGITLAALAYRGHNRALAAVVVFAIVGLPALILLIAGGAS